MSIWNSASEYQPWAIFLLPLFLSVYQIFLLKISSCGWSEFCIYQIFVFALFLKAFCFLFVKCSFFSSFLSNPPFPSISNLSSIYFLKFPFLSFLHLPFSQSLVSFSPFLNFLFFLFLKFFFPPL
jgi:hypothetical protein